MSDLKLTTQVHYQEPHFIKAGGLPEAILAVQSIWKQREETLSLEEAAPTAAVKANLSLGLLGGLPGSGISGGDFKA